MFMPEFQCIGSWRDALDAEATIGGGYSVERVLVDTDEGLHPAVDVALDNDVTWTGCPQVRADLDVVFTPGL